MATPPIHVLQITDLHLRAVAGERLIGVDTDASLRAVLQAAMAQQAPDALLVTGDVAHDPEPQAYQRCLDIIAEFYSGPKLLLPGNHDVAAAMVPSAYAQQQLNVGDWTLLAMDSHVDDQPQAKVEPEHWQWLQEQLRRCGSRPVLLATHHPPVLIDSPWLDKDRIQDAAELLDWAAVNANVKALAFGHAHQEVSALHESAAGDIALLGAPSTCFQFAPGSQQFSVDQQPPGYRTWQLYADGNFSSQVHRVTDFTINIELDPAH
jgi:Icc protein